MLISIKEAQAQLPKVGEKRMEHPAVDDTRGGYTTLRPQECVVVAVHPAHLWYTVEFKNGIRESYKVPLLRPLDRGGHRK